MGRKIIFNLADFSANAVDVTPNYHKTIVGTSKELWNKATNIVSEGDYGFLNPVSGLLTGAIINIANSEHNDLSFYGRIYNIGSGSGNYESSVSVRTNADGITYLAFPTPLRVQAGQVVSLHCPANVTYYNSKKGDVDTYTYGILDTDTPRCFQFNLIIETPY